MKKIKNKNKVSHPKALYIHIPFCSHICAYCDFCKMEYFSYIVDKYLPSLFKEIDSYNIKKLDTIYIGGGTPTSLSDEQLASLLIHVSPLTKDVKEYTVEANVESLTKSKLHLLKKYGVNRLSIGVESTDDNILKSINRVHTFSEVKRVIEEAKFVGFDNINVDLILGLPGTTIKTIENDLKNILNLDVQHVSTYSLTIHPHTKFGVEGVEEVDEETSRREYDLVNEILTVNGFDHYEISNFAKNGYQSLHNLTYWRDEQYYGVGLGASGYIGNLRYTNTKNINKYIANNYIDYREIVTKKDDEEYFVMLNLRTSEGIDDIKYINHFGYSFIEKHKDALAEFAESKLIKIEQGKVIATYEGMMVLDFLIKRFCA